MIQRLTDDEFLLDGGDSLYYQMGDAWVNKSISPVEFRKCLSSDLSFCLEFEKAIIKKKKTLRDKIEHEAKVKAAMENMKW